MFTLHGLTPSPFMRKAIVSLEEMGAEWQQHDLAPFPKTPELLSMNPLGTIPILEHDGRFIPDSSVIAAYADRVLGGTTLYPKDAAEFADALFLEEFIDSKVMAAIGPVLFQRFVTVQVFGGESDEAIVRAKLENDVPPVLDYLESRLSEGATTLLSHFTIADAAAAGCLFCLPMVGETIDPTRWPKLAAYLDSLVARPSYARAMPKG